MDIPFKFVVYELTKPFKKGDERYDIHDYSSAFFTEELNPRRNREEIIITENRDILLYFNSLVDAESRLYIDNLDYYHHDLCKEDSEGKLYITAGEDTIRLYENSKQVDFYPFIPGDYRISILCQSKRYYAYVKVKPKQISHNQLSIMRDELESTIENLAHVLVNNRSAKNEKSLTVNITSQMLILSENYKKIISLLNDIKESPTNKISNTYNLKTIEKARVIDQQTIKHYLRNITSHNKLLVPNRTISFDLEVNHYIIKKVNYLNKRVTVVINYLEKVINHLDYEFQKNSGDTYFDKKKYHEQKNSLEQNLENIKKIRKASSSFLSYHWVRELSSKQKNIQVISSIMDSRYNYINSICRNLKQNKQTYSLDKEFAYKWRRTDKLYEMWGFVKFLRVLQSENLQFTPVSGWIYSRTDGDGSYNIPVLEEGTEIILERENIQIKLIYDKQINRDRLKTNFNDPLYTHFPNNRPDARIDIYRDERYEASFILDFKYRPSNAIGNLNVNDYNNEWKAYKQLLHYSKFDSEFVGKSTKHTITHKKYTRKTSPIAGVWVIYPNSFERSPENIRTTEWLTKIPFSPGENDEVLGDFIFSEMKSEGFIEE